MTRLLRKKAKPTEAAAEGEKALALTEGAVADNAIHSLHLRAWQQAGNPERAVAQAATLRALESATR